MKLPVALLVLGVSLCSCATITRGTTQAFTITSEPTGADVRLSNGLAFRLVLTGAKGFCHFPITGLTYTHEVHTLSSFEERPCPQCLRVTSPSVLPHAFS